MAKAKRKRKLTVKRAAEIVIDQIDLCVMQREDKCDCVPVAEKLIHKLMAQLSTEGRKP